MLENKSKSYKVALTTAAVIGFTFLCDLSIHSLYYKTPIGGNWNSVERYLLLLLSSFLFVRGVYGFKRDKANTKLFGRIYAGYQWKSFEPVQLLDAPKELPNEDEMKPAAWEGKVKSIAKKYLTYFLIGVGVFFAIETILWDFSDYRTIVSINSVNPMHGVSAWGNSEAIFNLIALFEIAIQTVFMLVFMRGVIGFYHDYQYSIYKGEGRFVIFETIDITKIVNKFQKLKFKRKSTETKE